MTWEINRLNKRLNLESKILEKVYAIIGKIDTVKINFSLTTNLLPQTIHRLTSSLVVTSTGASNRIEGNQLSDEQIEKLYKNLNIKKLAKSCPAEPTPELRKKSSSILEIVTST